MKKTKRTYPDIEQFTKDIPVPEVPDSSWEQIESSLPEIAQNHENRERRNGFSSIRFMQPSTVLLTKRIALAALFLVIVSTGWYLLQHSESLPSQQQLEQYQLIESAESDLNMAIQYYERAIHKLELATEGQPTNLEPELESLYREKISSLRTSISECKEALSLNRQNPTAKRFLFASYIELQSTLESLSNSTVIQ